MFGPPLRSMTVAIDTTYYVVSMLGPRIRGSDPARMRITALPRQCRRSRSDCGNVFALSVSVSLSSCVCVSLSLSSPALFSTPHLVFSPSSLSAHPKALLLDSKGR